MNLFKDAAKYYKFRTEYPEALIELLISKLRLDNTSNLLDIGCGTGSLSIPLSKYFKHVFAVDVDDGMLAEGRKRASTLGIQNIDWINKPGEDLGHFDGVRAVSFGFSLHWFDSDKILSYAYGLLPKSGAVLITSGTTIWRYAPQVWQQKTLEIIKKYLGPDRLTLNGKYEPPKNTFEKSLKMAGFRNLDKFDFMYPPSIKSADDIIGMCYSTSYAAPQLFKDRISDFENELKAELLKLNPDNKFEEKVKDSIIIAWKV